MMTDPLRLFILAGEASGDRLGADLVERLRAQVKVALTGVGGCELEAAGLRSLFPMRELSVMGWADVLPRLPRLLWRVRQVARTILRQNPDVVVLIDAQVFSALVARMVRRGGGRMPMLLYVAPAVWAWKPERAPKLAALFDEVLAVLPFEPQVMAELGGPSTHYVGHPAVRRLAWRPELPERGPMVLLPGSREGELRRHLPLMQALARRLAGHPRITHFLLPTPPQLRARLEGAVSSWDTPVTVVADAAGRQDAFASAVAACAVTGTVTLELALAGVPMVTTYVADKGQARRWVDYQVRFAALPNAILDRELVPEVLGITGDVAVLEREVRALLERPPAAAAQLAGFAELRLLMAEGCPGAPVVDPAERVLSRAGGAQRSASAT